MVDLKEITQKLIQGMAPQVKELVQEAINEGQDLGSILNDGLLAGMSVVGERFKKTEVYWLFRKGCFRNRTGRSS
jgi:5-methyltetrahydrofolate--homocysteine methyltransferase